MTTSCPFCHVPTERIIAGNDLAFAIRDLYPVSPGHTLVIPRQHVGDWWGASGQREAMLELLDEVKRGLDEQFRPDGYNIGINNGEAAGQTVFHLHLHLIPRFAGDVADPRGGVRHVIPARARDMLR